MRREDVKWVPPNLGSIKVKIDAAVNNKENRIGLGVVARNEAGTVLLVASKTLWPSILMGWAELEAFQLGNYVGEREALELCHLLR